MTITETAFYFARHGQTDWNVEGRKQGQTDIPLNEEGRRQAHVLAEKVAMQQIGTICASPLSRALETAQIVAKKCAMEIIVLDGLLECAWGEREGDMRSDWYDRWKAGTETPVGAETFTGFLRRATNGINEALTHPGPVLIVSHGGVYRAVRKFATREPHSTLPNATLMHLTPPRTSGANWNSKEL